MPVSKSHLHGQDARRRAYRKANSLCLDRRALRCLAALRGWETRRSVTPRADPFGRAGRPVESPADRSEVFDAFADRFASVLASTPTVVRNVEAPQHDEEQRTGADSDGGLPGEGQHAAA